MIKSILESIFDNATVEKVLLYLQNYNEVYASEIAATFSISLSVVQKQLKRLKGPYYNWIYEIIGTTLHTSRYRVFR